MQHGVWLGLWGFLSLTSFRWSLVYDGLSLLTPLLMFGTPVFAAWLTFRFRAKAVMPGEGLSFGRAFVHTMLTGFYAAVWIALGIYVYLQYVDGGAIFDDYARRALSPENLREFETLRATPEFAQMAGDASLKEIVEAMPRIGAAGYAAMALHGCFFIGPIISAIIAAFAMKRPEF